MAFAGATFYRGQVSFGRATFSGSQVVLLEAMFYGGKVSFDRATFSAGQVTFYEANLGRQPKPEALALPAFLPCVPGTLVQPSWDLL